MKNTCKKEICKVCFNGFTEETCPKRKLENERLVLSTLLLVLLGYVMYGFM